MEIGLGYTSDQMVESDFHVKGESWHFAKKLTQPDMFFKGATSIQNSKLQMGLPLYGNDEM